jgi:hypothetical protein
MSIFNPIIGILHNTALNRWHPIVFLEDPLSGPPTEDKPVRHKSKMHHTGGFPTREEAIADIPNLEERCKQVFVGEVGKALAEDMPWDGQGIPTMVEFFIKNDDGTYRSSAWNLQISVG